jgi:multiple antibiotic resistance protein
VQVLEFAERGREGPQTMSDFWNNFVLTFIPLFIVVDAFGNIPFVISMGEAVERPKRLRLINIAIITATLVGLVFLFFGQFILKTMNISVGSFAIAGGIILVVLSMKFITTGRMVSVVEEELMAVVPIGTPLTVGPATITTLILLATQYPIYTVLISFALNMVIAWIIFLVSNQLSHFLGKGGIKAVSQVFNLLLAAIGVTMVLRGLDLTGIIKLSS